MSPALALKETSFRGAGSLPGGGENVSVSPTSSHLSKKICVGSKTRDSSDGKFNCESGKWLLLN